ncbi:MAG: hypothetical protein JWM32_130 [Verrucomicrobia bacterium]|nr:hypothetical protein [Verrucomicrobiota bacterium]
MLKPSSLRLPILLLAVGSAALTIAAGLMLFSTFMYYDDEGYVLISLRNFAEHGSLYRDVYTQYGPFPYVLYYVLNLLGMPLVHFTGRILTLGMWSTCATLSAWTVWRATRNSACMLATLSAVFVYLWIMVSEPTHPGGLVAFVTALMGLGGYLALGGGKWKTWAGIVGVGSAALLLTKINVGAFATLSAVMFLLLHSRSDRTRRAMPWVLGAGLLVFPFALMRPLLGTAWVQTYALAFAFAAIPVAATLSMASDARAGGREWRTAIIGGAVLALAVLGVVFARGTSPAELLQGVLLGPLHHPGNFSLKFKWPPGVLVAGILSLAIFLVLFAAARMKARRIALDTCVALSRLLAGVGLAWSVWQFPATSPDITVFAFSISLLWTFLWPLTGEPSGAVVARGWLGLLFLGQWLHAFPVPGSQVAWGTFLALPLAVIGGWEAASWLTDRHGRVLTFRRVKSLGLVLTFLLVMMAVVVGNRLARIGARYLDSRSLDLPGAEVIRLPDSTTGLYRVLAINAEAHSDMLFSVPGMFSLNLWTGLPAPTWLNVTHWFSLLSEAQQRAVMAELEKHPRACVIVNLAHIDFLRNRGLAPKGPLYDFVMSQYESAFAVDGFQFRVRRGRHVAPFFTAEVFQQKTADPAAPNTLVKLDLLLPSDEAVATIEVTRMDHRESPPLVLSAANARVEITPMDLEGHPRGQPMPATFPFSLQEPAEVAIYFDRAAQGFASEHAFFVVRNKAGAELALVRIRD